MTSPWAPPSDAPTTDDPPLRADALAAALTGVVLVLLGAPVGLLWAAVAPRVQVVLSDAGPDLQDPETGAFAGADVAFGVVVLLVGVACGLLAFRLGRAYGPGVVVGLVAGGLLAAYVAARTGEQVGREAFQEALADLGRRGRIDASVQLRATEAVVLWPVGALAAFGGATAVGTSAEPRPVSSG